MTFIFFSIVTYQYFNFHISVAICHVMWGSFILMNNYAIGVIHSYLSPPPQFYMLNHKIFDFIEKGRVIGFQKGMPFTV